MSFLDSIPVVSSYRKSNRADDIVAQAKRSHRRAKWDLEDANQKSCDLVDELFDLKTECATTTIENAITVLETCQKVNRVGTEFSQDAFDSFTSDSLPSLKRQSITASEAISSGVKGTAAGAALSLGSIGAVSAYGAASTGAAISALSGVAAQNATLAWFGGGALSAGGAGIAGGTMVLGGIALAPLAVIGAFKYASHAEKKLTEAYDFQNQVHEIIAQIDAAIEIADSLNNHVRLFQETLLRMKNYLTSVTIALSDLVEEKEAGLIEEKEADFAIEYAKCSLILFIKATKRLLEVTLFDDQQQPTPESLRIISHAENTNSDAVLSLIGNVQQGNEITPPNDVTYLSQIEPGIDSPKFFWLLDVYAEYKKVKKRKVKRDSDDTEIRFKDALVVCAIAVVGFFISLMCLSLWGMLLSFWVFINMPILWVNYVIKNEKFEMFAGLFFYLTAGAGLLILFMS